jgi:hypothetical protein
MLLRNNDNQIDIAIIYNYNHNNSYIITEILIIA